jgi:integrase
MPTDKLTDAAIRNAKPADTGKPVRLFDGGGMYVEVSPTGGRLWRLKYRIDGRERRISLGVYPETGLKDARRKRDEARKLLANGVDPSENRKAVRASRAAATSDSFEVVAREWWSTLHKHEVSAAHADRTLARLQSYVFPYLGAKRLRDITAPELLQVVKRIEARGTIETAHRTLSACGMVFRYGIPSGRSPGDISRDLRDALKSVIVHHMPAIVDPERAGDLLRAMDSYRGMPTTRAALQLAPLVFIRPGELRKAEWAEIDLDAGTWFIPAARMKGTKQQKISGTAHFVPLARQAVVLLRDLHAITGRGRYIFPSLRTGERPMSDNAVLAALRRMGFPKDEVVGHGFRAMARTMLEERLHFPVPVIEAQLAHSVKDALGRAYNRTEHHEQRRQMMQVWADYLDALRRGDQLDISRSTPKM